MKDCFAVIVLIILVGQSSSLALSKHQDALTEFCWKDSYGRGVGTIPTTCGALDKIGLLCYPKCPAGYSRFGFDCHQNCPDGWADQGLFCRLAEYGRGAGYAWKFGDALNDKGMKGRCEAANGKGNCEKNGLIYYPKCKPGYFNVGCCICRPTAPNCGALGFNNGIDLSCAKKIIIGAPKSMSCSANLEYDAGLCYPNCKTGFYGVGPVCWADAPANWVGCGMGAAKTTMVCSTIVFGQVTSVGNMALNIATAGAGKTGSIAKDSAQASELKKKFEALKKLIKENEKVKSAIEKGQKTFLAVKAGKNVADILIADPDTVTP